MRFAFCCDRNNTYYLEVLAGVKKWLQENPSVKMTTWLSRECVSARALAYLEVEGILVGPLLRGNLPENCRNIPLVGFSNAFEAPEYSVVVNDDREIGMLAARTLVDAGYQHIIAMKAGSRVGELRLAGFMEQMGQLHIPVQVFSGEIRVPAEGETFKDILIEQDQQMGLLVESLQANSGIFCQSTSVAAELIRRIKEKTAFSIPDEVGLINGDLSSSPVEDYTMTHIQLAGEAIGRTACELLRKEINDPPGSNYQRIEVKPLRVVMGNTLRIAHEQRLFAEMSAFFGSRLGDPINVTDAASHLGMSRRVLEMSLRRKGLPSPYDHLTELRLRYAEELLLNSDLSIELIAEKCGFSEMRSFTKRFRQRRGCPPSVFRRQINQQSAVAGANSAKAGIEGVAPGRETQTVAARIAR